MGRHVAVLFQILAAFAGSAQAEERTEDQGSEAKPGQDIRVTLTEAVHSAVANNPNIARLEIDSKIAQIEISRKRGIFDPLVRAAGSLRQENQYVTQAEATVDGLNTSTRALLETSIVGRTSFGATYSAGYTLGRAKELGEPGFFIRLTPRYTNTLWTRVTQPLRRDAGFTPNRGLVRRASLAAEVTRSEQREALEALVLEVAWAYWDLVWRGTRLQINEANLAEALKIRDLVERQVRGGRAPRSDIAQADVIVAQRRQAIEMERIGIVDSERTLLSLMHLTRGRLSSIDLLTPVDEPREVEVDIDFDAQLAIALANRPEIRRVERAIELARLNAAIARNQRKIRLDIYAEAGVVGFAGRNVIPSELPLSPPPPLVQGGLRTAFDNLSTGKAPYLEVGVQLEFALGNRDLDGAARQAALLIERENPEGVRSQVTHDVRAAVQRLTIIARRLRNARDTVSLAEENVAAQEARYRGGAGILFDVFRAQEELARAQAEVVIAASEQELALIMLEAARGTLLTRFKIGIEEE